MAILVILSAALGVVGSYFLYFLYTRAVGRLDDRLDSIEQPMMSPPPVVDAKPAEGKPVKGKKGH